MTHWILPIVSVFLAASAGCGLRRGDVQREWTNTLREFGINPIYPPREDVQVGDIYLRRGNPADPSLIPESGFVPMDALVGHVNVQKQVTEFYLARQSFASTPSSEIAAAAPAEGVVPAAASARVARNNSDPVVSVPRTAFQEGTFKETRLSSLRQVAFPDFSKLSLRGADLQAFFPVEALTVALGGMWSGSHEMQVKISSGESYAIPAAALLGSIAENKDGKIQLRKDLTGIDPAFFKIFYAGQNHWHEIVDREQKEAPGQAKLVYVDLITEVYYARSFDIGITRSSSGGAGAEVRAIDAAIEGKIEKTAAAIAGAPEGGTGAAAESQPPSARTGYKRAEEINKELEEALAETNVGGRAKFLYVSDTSIQMRRTYERPIAVGYRGITLGVEPQEGYIVSIVAASAAKGAFTAGLADAFTKRLNEISAAFKSVLNQSGVLSPQVDRVTFEKASGESIPPIRVTPVSEVLQPNVDAYQKAVAGELRKKENIQKIEESLKAKIENGALKTLVSELLEGRFSVEVQRP